jgi:Co/Zn/Cd efflux system component
VRGNARFAFGGWKIEVLAAYSSGLLLAVSLWIGIDAGDHVLAIVALGAGLGWGWRWLDPTVAIAGGALIAHRALTVLRGSARSLVDATSDTSLRDAVRGAIEADGDALVADLHVWQVGPLAWSAALSVVADQPLAAWLMMRSRTHTL